MTDSAEQTPVADPTWRVPKEPRDVLGPDSTALLLWDLQAGLGGQALGLTELTAVWRRLREAAQECAVLVAWSYHIAAPPQFMSDVQRWRVARRPHGENRPEHYMQRGGADTEFLPGFQPGSDDLVVEKSAPSLFHATNADIRLRARGIRTLVLAGVATEQGIDFTARHAMALGYFAVVCEDGVGSYSGAAHDHGMALLRRSAMVATSEEIIAAWRKAF